MSAVQYLSCPFSFDAVLSSVEFDASEVLLEDLLLG